MGAAPAYAYPRPQRERAYAHSERPHVEVLRGSGTRTAVQKVSGAFIAAVIIASLIVAAWVAVGVARVALNSATVTTSLATQEISSDLDEARSYAATLEVQQSTLSNPTRVRTAAADLDMAAPVVTETIVLPTDVVATDEAGNLSLTESIRLAAAAGA